MSLRSGDRGVGVGRLQAELRRDASDSAVEPTEYRIYGSRRRWAPGSGKPGWRKPVVIGLTALASLLGTGLALSSSDEPDGEGAAGTGGSVIVVTDGKTLLEAGAEDVAARSPRGLRRLLSAVPDERRVRRGAGRATLETDRGALLEEVRSAAAGGGGIVEVPEAATSARTRLPIVEQAYRNNCETAALSMLLAAEGVRVDQVELQEQVAKSEPLDAELEGDGDIAVWGDPREGYVGRADGGGTAGGYGVYEGPIVELAARHDVPLRKLSGGDPDAIYDSLLAGRPVMIWLGLSEGPYETWRSPEGKRVSVNFGEHTVVLTGVDGDRLAVNDPLTGERTSWSKRYFEEVWPRIDERAVAI